MREAEERQQAELIARQSEDVQAKQEQERKRKEQQELEEKEKTAGGSRPGGNRSTCCGAGRPRRAPTEGTLHKPTPKPGEKKPEKKNEKKVTRQAGWADDSATSACDKNPGRHGRRGWLARAQSRGKGTLGRERITRVLLADRTDRA